MEDGEVGHIVKSVATLLAGPPTEKSFFSRVSLNFSMPNAGFLGEFAGHPGAEADIATRCPHLSKKILFF